MINIKKKHRSFSSVFVEKMIRLSNKKIGLIDEEMMSDFLEKRRIINSQAFVIPSFIKDVKEEKYGLLKTYTFNSESKEEKIIYYFPGGGYVFWPNNHEIKMISKIAKKVPYKIVMIVYPLIPIITVKELYTLLISYLKKVIKEGDFFIGDSAGGGLALGVSMELHKLGLVCPSKIFLLSPWVDVSMKNSEALAYCKDDPMLEFSKLEAIGKVWNQGLKDNDYHTSPLYGDFTGIGQLIIYIGTREIFYPDVVRMSKKLDVLGIEHELIVGEKMNHVWVSYPTKEGKMARELLINQIING